MFHLEWLDFRSGLPSRPKEELRDPRVTERKRSKISERLRRQTPGEGKISVVTNNSESTNSETEKVEWESDNFREK